MTVILRHRPSGFYYGAPHYWVHGHERALDFTSLDRATDAAKEVSFGGMEIVASFGEPDCELVLPVRSNGTSRDTTTLGPSEPVASLLPPFVFEGPPPPPNLSAPELC